jgi:hypothetical protein
LLNRINDAPDGISTHGPMLVGQTSVPLQVIHVQFWRIGRLLSRKSTLENASRITGPALSLGFGWTAAGLASSIRRGHVNVMTSPVYDLSALMARLDDEGLHPDLAAGIRRANDVSSAHRDID